jgi:hypothetical protein
MQKNLKITSRKNVQKQKKQEKKNSNFLSKTPI